MMIAKHASPDAHSQIAIWTQGSRHATYTIGRLNLRGEVIAEIGYRSTEAAARKVANRTWLADAGRTA